MPSLTTITIETAKSEEYKAGITHSTGYTPIRVIPSDKGCSFVICSTGPEGCSTCIANGDNLKSGCEVPLDPRLRR